MSDIAADLAAESALTRGVDPNLAQRASTRRMRYCDEYGAIERPSEARQALTYVLGSLDAGVSLEALERAIATIRQHLEA